jgi:predicted ArsR family transcriptional regulator
VALNVFELIADPVRLAIVRQLSTDGSAPLIEIADRAGVHVNTVRSHMAELELAGVVERESAAPDGPGRPQVRYRLCPGWRLPSDDMRGLSELLAALVTRLEPASKEIEQFGSEWGRFLSGRPGGDALAGLPRALERLGFDADVDIDGRTIRLRSCPCVLVSPEHPELICALAKAAIEGILGLGHRRMEISAAEHDPPLRSCTIHLTQAPLRRGGAVREAGAARS